MNRPPSPLLTMPSSPRGTWWARLRDRFALSSSVLKEADARVMVAFWLFGLINNVLYVVILSAAQDLVGTLPKGIVLLADVAPSFLTKLVAPYVIHHIPYGTRIAVFVALSTAGMLLLAVTPAEKSVGVKLLGVVLASLSSGGGELSFLGLTHYYGHMSLAAWGSGTGAAGLVGAGLYVLLREGVGLGVRGSLGVCAVLPVGMVVGFWGVLDRGVLEDGRGKGYVVLGDGEEEEDGEGDEGGEREVEGRSFMAQLRRSRALFVPYMLPLLLVYIAEYTINQGVAPTLLFPLDQSPFDEFRAFYPVYGFLYQLGVFISRSASPFVRIHRLYLPALLQVVNLVVLTLHALLGFLPSVYVVFVIVFWEGLLGGAVYVNTFAEIMEKVPKEEREFSLGATSVSDSGGICVAGFVGMTMEVWLCEWQVRHGRDWCRHIKAS
ncbi:CLN3 protein-domain-containing protein [Podospora appendiculata]|uniref:Protein BTN n=1 Tax=Podospora appendiculata TaxID=314037 RepID=A0AAE0X1W6_9PEZI|nr:CLN3 protein-domain-containing protein [Podospora appendiculata]